LVHLKGLTSLKTLRIFKTNVSSVEELKTILPTLKIYFKN